MRRKAPFTLALALGAFVIAMSSGLVAAWTGKIRPREPDAEPTPVTIITKIEAPCKTQPITSEGYLIWLCPAPNGDAYETRIR